MVENPPAMQETQVRSLGWEDPLEKEMATHTSVLAWEIPWTEASTVLGVAKGSDTIQQLNNNKEELIVFTNTWFSLLLDTQKITFQSLAIGWGQHNYFWRVSFKRKCCVAARLKLR